MANDPAPTAPDDEWDSLPRDDELSGVTDDPPAEEAALHVVDGDVARVRDPGRADVAVGPDDDGEAAAAHFPDEDTGVPVGGDEHEPDLEEILESQHYAFPADGDDD